MAMHGEDGCDQPEEEIKLISSDKMKLTGSRESTIVEARKKIHNSSGFDLTTRLSEVSLALE